MAVQQTDIFGIMRADLDRVNERVIEAALVRYPAASELLEDIVQAGGKQLRPLLLLLSGRPYAYAESFDRLVTAAAGVELLHIASLVHDDTVDRAALRRGKPTLNSVLSSGAVILIGDYLFAQSAMLAAATDSTRVVAVFASTLGAICDGQLLEMFEASNMCQTVASYDERIHGKTAALFAGAAEMGAILSGAPEAHIAALKGYGADLGLAFQVIDDILDLVGGSDQLGKPAGNDLRQGTITLPVILYLEKVGEGSPEWQAIQRIVSGMETDDAAIDHTIDRIRTSGAVDQAFEVAEAHVRRARARIAVVPDPGTRELLYDLADSAVTRVS